MVSRRSMRVWPCASRRSSSTERISEPSCSFWLRFWALSLSSSARCTRSAARWNRLTVAHEQVVEVGFEAGVTQRRDQGIEDVGDGATDDAILGQRSRVGLVLEGAVAMEPELGEDVIGRR